MTDALTTTYAEICRSQLRPSSIKRLLRHVGKTPAEMRLVSTLPLLAVLDSNGSHDALQVLDCTAGHGHIRRLIASDFVERALPHFLAMRPEDGRPAAAIRVARDRDATDEDRDLALAALEEAEDDIMPVRLVASKDNAPATAAVSVVDAARSAVMADALDASADAAWAISWTAPAEVRRVKWQAERTAQAGRLRQYLIHGEAAQHLPWEA
ncbi:hypothetical protein [Frigidibacter oleivorans]|uniref:hypothetical protein n=1 Tax=Frigidibacter oleivorans TaxID=2487129 RepID=UPI000F8D50AE|nr:hypothetical protein [Frigidibacter oleivorans]